MSEFDQGWEAGQRDALANVWCEFYMSPPSSWERGYMRGWLYTRMYG